MQRHNHPDCGDTGYSVAVQADGRNVVTDSAWNGNNKVFALVRYEGQSATANLKLFQVAFQMRLIKAWELRCSE